MSLPEKKETFRSLMASHGPMIQELIATDGELSEAQDRFIHSLVQKVEDLNTFRSALEAEEDRFSEMLDTMSAHKKRIATKRAWLDQYVIANMKIQGLTEICGDMVKLVLQANPESVVIVNEALLPSTLVAQKEVITYSPDKKAIAKQLKAGIEVPGAKLVRSVKLVSKPNSILIKSNVGAE